MADSTGLTGYAAAGDGDDNVNLAQQIGGDQRLTDDQLQGVQTEILVDVTAVGCVVSNTSTAKAISDAIQKGLPLVERVVSVTGEFIRNPGNYIVKLGTNVQEIIDHCGGITGDDVVLKMGGPMMGAPIKDTNVPIIKGSNGIIAIAADHTEEKECIKCGRCMDVCPMELAPLDIYKYAQLGDAETLLKLNVMDCFSCKCCEYICSSKIPLVSKINAAKGLVMPLLKKK